MDIITIPPFTSGSVVWQEQPGTWTLTVVCKITYALAPGVAAVESEQEAINEHDNHWDDDPERSVYAPSDLAPYKPRPEVVLVGSAFSPAGQPVRSLYARLVVGGLDKSIEVFGPRFLTSEGALAEGPRFTKMALRYERAAGGEGSWNPVGVDPNVVDAYGKRALPNLQPPGLPEMDQGALENGEAIPITGFGPIAARWGIRQEKLGALGPAILAGLLPETPLGIDFDGSYFQTAPEDQRVDELRPDEPIVLENLHPRGERIATRLPGIRPRTRVEIEGMPPWELDLVPDTLWIDTDRAICTLTFRGQLPLDGRDQQGRILIGIEHPNEPVAFPLANPIRNPAKPEPHIPARQEPEDDDVELTRTDADSLGITGKNLLPFAAEPALPFSPKSVAATIPAAPKPPPRPARTPGDPDETSVFVAPNPRGRMPTWLGGTAAPAAASASASAPASAPVSAPVSVPAPAPASASPAPPPPVSQMLRTSEPAPFNMVDASNNAVGVPKAHRPSSPSVPGVIVPPFASVAPPVPLPAMATPRASQPGTTFGQAAVLAAAKTSKPSSPTLEAQPERERERPRSGGITDPRALATAAFLGATEASNAAATKLDEPQDTKKEEKVQQNTTASQSPLRILIDFLWFAPELPPRLPENETWKRLLEPAPAPKNEPDDDSSSANDEEADEISARPKKKPAERPREKTAEEKQKDDKSRVSKVLSRAQPTLDIESALFQAINDDGVLEPPLAVVSGDLELPFDEVETLKVLTSAAAPLALGDKKLKEIIDLANEALGTPLGSSPEVAASFSIRVRDAWVKANRMLAPDYLDIHSRRVLLEQRKYQIRELIGASWIRALLHSPSTEKPIPTYLPADLKKQLPLFIKFPARLIVEILPQQDQNEPQNIALKGLALARTIAGRPRR